MSLKLEQAVALQRTYKVGKMGKSARIIVPKSLIGLRLSIIEWPSKTVLQNANVCASHNDNYGRITLNLEHCGKIVELKDVYSGGITNENIINMYIQEHKTREEILKFCQKYDAKFNESNLNSILGKQ